MNADNREVNNFYKKILFIIFSDSFEDGFSLLELLTVFGIIAILTSLGVAAYNSYNSSQTVQSSANDVATMLNTAKSKSLTQVIPASCGTNPVTGYQVDITINGGLYTLSAFCGGKQIITQNNLSPGITFVNGSTTTVFFNIGTGTVASTATITISQTGTSKTKTITVSQTGDVSIQ